MLVLEGSTVQWKKESFLTCPQMELLLFPSSSEPDHYHGCWIQSQYQIRMRRMLAIGTTPALLYNFSTDICFYG
jgi:hypothetical protein